MTREQLIKILHTSTTFSNDLTVAPCSVIAYTLGGELSFGEVEFLNGLGLEWRVDIMEGLLCVIFKVEV